MTPRTNGKRAKPAVSTVNAKHLSGVISVKSEASENNCWISTRSAPLDLEAHSLFNGIHHMQGVAELKAALDLLLLR